MLNWSHRNFVLANDSIYKGLLSALFFQVSVMKDQEMRNSFGEDLPHLHDLGRSSLWYSAIDKEMLGCFIIISVNDDCELVLRTIIELNLSPSTFHNNGLPSLTCINNEFLRLERTKKTLSITDLSAICCYQRNSWQQQMVLSLWCTIHVITDSTIQEHFLWRLS